MTKKIMIVDDEPEIVETVEIMLQSGGYKTIPAYSGEECFNKLEKEKPDLILLDIMMKPMNGWQVLRKIKSNENLRDIAVSMFSLNPLTPEILDKEGIGEIENYIMKPFTTKELLEKIKEIWENKEKIENKKAKIDNKLGKKTAQEYEKLAKQISRHKKLIEALKKSASLEGRETNSMKLLIANQEKMVSIWEKKIKELERKIK